MIFVHSGWRTASTYLWSLFRKAPRTVAYCEIFHEGLATLRRADLIGTSPDSWYSKHPSGAPYFLEFLPLLRDDEGVEHFDRSMSYERFVPAGGCGGPISDGEARYVAHLISQAEDRQRIPILTATRSLGRLRGLRAAFPGLHILLYRNLFQQWCSFSEQAFRGNTYFFDRMLGIINLNPHDKTFSDIRQIFPSATSSPENADLFYCFIFFHLHLYVQSSGVADLIIDIGRVPVDPAYRGEVEARIATQDVRIDLSGATNSIAYSLCSLGKGAEVTDRLKVIGDAVIDRAPDDAGRIFGRKVMSELMEEHARSEFHSAGLRSVLVGTDGLLGERNRLQVDRQALAAERDALRLNLDQTSAERDAALATQHSACTERDTALAERDSRVLDLDRLARERDRSIAERDDVLVERDILRQRCGSLDADRDRLQAEREAALTDRDALQSRCDRADIERDQSRTERDDALARCDAALAAQAALRRELERANSERDQLRTERDAAIATQGALRLEGEAALGHRAAQGAEIERLVEQRDLALERCERLADDIADLRVWAAADRAAMLQSLSWRLTRPLRRLGYGRPLRPPPPTARNS